MTSFPILIIFFLLFFISLSILILFDYKFGLAMAQSNEVYDLYPGKIFLTYDDGPSQNGNLWGDQLITDPELQKIIKNYIPDYDFQKSTSINLLKMLNNEKHKGIFFIQGQAIKGNELAKETIQLIHEGSHLIGNHSFSHRNCTELLKEEVVKDFEHSHQLISDISGQNPLLFRPPMGFWENSLTIEAWKSHQLQDYQLPLFWDYAFNECKPFDPQILPDLEKSVQDLLKKSQKGGGRILLLHDVYMNGPILTKLVLENIEKFNLTIGDPNQLLNFSKNVTTLYKKSTFLYYLLFRVRKIRNLIKIALH